MLPKVVDKRMAKRAMPSASRSGLGMDSDNKAGWRVVTGGFSPEVHSSYDDFGAITAV